MSAHLIATKIYLERLEIVQSVEAAFALDVFLLQVISILLQYFSNALLFDLNAELFLQERLCRFDKDRSSAVSLILGYAILFSF